MSLLRLARRALPIASAFFPGAGAISGAMAAARGLSGLRRLRAGAGAGQRNLLALPGPVARQLPSVGTRVGTVARRVGGAAGLGATAALVYDQFGNPIGRRRRRRAKGLSARDIQGCQRVNRLLERFGCKPQAQMRRSKRKRCP